MDRKTDRRGFLRTTAALAAGATILPGIASLADRLAAAGGPELKLPQRRLGRTRAMVSILGVGGGGILSDSADPDFVIRFVNEALDSGINYFDVAFNYGKDGSCEKNLGLVMGTARRKEAFLATKCEDRTRDGAMRQVEMSLKRLRVEWIDLIQVHQIGDKDDLKAMGQKDGVLAALHSLQDQKLVRFIGMTGHPDSPRVKDALAMHDWDTLLCWVNPSPACLPVFDDQLPIARRKNMGVVGMKTFGGGTGLLVGTGDGKGDAPSLMRYAWSQSVTTIAPGVNSLAQLRQNVAIARSFHAMSAKEQHALAERVNAKNEGWSAAFHQDGYAADA